MNTNQPQLQSQVIALISTTLCRSPLTVLAVNLKGNIFHFTKYVYMFQTKRVFRGLRSYSLAALPRTLLTGLVFCPPVVTAQL